MLAHAVSNADRLRSAIHSRAQFCSFDGAFVGDVPLFRKAHSPTGAAVWVVRQSAALNIDLGSGYCLPVAAGRIVDQLGIIAGALNKGDIAGAQAMFADLDYHRFQSDRTDV